MNTAQQDGMPLSVVSPFTEVSPNPDSPPDVAARVHPTAILEEGVRIGNGTSVWDSAHIRENATIGEDCIIGEKTYIAYHVAIGNRVKINGGVYIPAGVTIADGVMISAGVIFANDRYPRATTPDLSKLRPSEPDDDTQSTWVQAGATIGAGAMVVGGIEIGAFAMVGMGSVVTKSVPAFHLSLGNPAKSVGTVCRCGRTTYRFEGGSTAGVNEVVQCAACGMRYQIRGNQVMEFNPPVAPPTQRRVGPIGDAQARPAASEPPPLPATQPLSSAFATPESPSLPNVWPAAD